MAKSVTASKQGLKFTFVKLKASGQTLVGEMGGKKDGLSFSLINQASFGDKGSIGLSTSKIRINSSN
jgi:hypothetical protein